MKRALLVFAAAVALVVTLGAAFVFRTLRRLGTPEFRREVLAEAAATLGTKVEARSLDISVLRGFRLRGLEVKNPAPLAGDLVTAESLSLGYDLWPLLRGRIQVDELSLEKPVVRLLADSRGGFNYERLKPYAAARAGAKSTSPGRVGFVPNLVIERLSVSDGALSLAEGRQVFLRLDDLDFESRIALEDRQAGGKGEARVGTVALAEALFLRDVRAPIVAKKTGLRLDPVAARLADGKVKGTIAVDLAPDLRWSLELAIEDASVATLLKEAGGAPTAEGRVAGRASLAGTGGVATARGKGQAEIRDCRLLDHAVTRALALALQMPELASPRFDECRVEFEVGGGVARTPVLRFKSRTLELTGRGTFGLVTSALDYDMTLALGPDVLARIPGNTTRAAFKKREDGFSTIDFGVTGTAAAPKVDLVQKLGASLATEAVKEGIRKLFRKKSD